MSDTIPVPVTGMTFNGQFNTFSSSPDGSSGTWMTSYPYGGESARTLPGNNEAEYYSDSSVGENPFSVSNGVLSITATPAAAGSNPYNLPYDSGLITTYASFSQLYGYFQVTAKLPDEQGLWPAFWMLPANNVYSSELDIFEAVDNQPNTIYSTTHGSTNGQWVVDSQAVTVPNTASGFNTYGVDWEPTTTTFYVNGVEVASAPTPSSMDTPMYMLLDLAVGGAGSWPGAPDSSTTFPASLQIQSVQAYATANTQDVSGSAAIAADEPPCFCRGTHIRTPGGEVPVEDLRVGDLVATASGAHRPLRWIGFGRTLVTPRNRDRATPVVVRRHALAEWVPHRDLYITRGHALYLDGALIPVEELVNHRSIAWVEDARVIEYYHLELDSHDVVIAEGAAAETYREDDNSPQFHNAGTRPPAPRPLAYAPVLHDHPTVKRVWRRLSDRAGRLDLDCTEDPDLHLLADGVRLAPVSVKASLWGFRLPAPVSDLRIVSRSVIPSMVGLAQDQRRLGVAVRRIEVAQTGWRMRLDWDADGLTAGFHDAEPGPRHRWTNGNAALPPALVAQLRAGATLKLHATGALPYPVGAETGQAGPVRGTEGGIVSALRRAA